MSDFDHLCPILAVSKIGHLYQILDFIVQFWTLVLIIGTDVNFCTVVFNFEQ